MLKQSKPIFWQNIKLSTLYRVTFQVFWENFKWILLYSHLYLGTAYLANRQIQALSHFVEYSYEEIPLLNFWITGFTEYLDYGLYGATIILIYFVLIERSLRIIDGEQKIHFQPLAKAFTMVTLTLLTVETCFYFLGPFAFTVLIILSITTLLFFSSWISIPFIMIDRSQNLWSAEKVSIILSQENQSVIWRLNAINIIAILILITGSSFISGMIPYAIHTRYALGFQYVSKLGLCLLLSFAVLSQAYLYRILSAAYFDDMKTPDEIDYWENKI